MTRYALGVLLLTSACTGARTARIYDARNGRESTLFVEQPPGSAAGRIRGALPSGEQCTGSFDRNADGARAVLACGRDRVIRCDVGTRREVEPGFGVCRDNEGATYDVFF
jgi:hypothetical protein